MADIYPSVLQGLLVPHRWFRASRIWATESSYTEAEGRPGVPTPSGNYDMVLEASGVQTSGTRNVKVQAGGYPERDGATVIVDSDDANWLGWDPPAAISSFDTIADQTIATIEYRTPSAVALPSGRVLVATSSIGAGASKVHIHRSGADGDGFATTELHSEASNGDYAHPVLVALPSGRVLCFFMVFDAANDLGQVRVYKTDNEGAGWSLYAQAVLPDALDMSTQAVERMRAAVADDGIVLVISYNPTSGVNGFHHYASSDYGSRFSLVFSGSVADVPAAGTRYVDVARTPEGGIQWAMLNDASTTTGIHFPFFHRAQRAFENIDDTAWLDYVRPSVNVMTNNAEKWPALVVSDDGIVYCFLSGVPSSSSDVPIGEIIASVDDGETFERWGIDIGGTTTGRWWSSAAGAAHPWYTQAIWRRGQVHLYAGHRDDHGGATNPDNLEVLRIGGHSNVTMGNLDMFETQSNTVSWTESYLPYELPTAVGWTASGTASSESVSAGYLDVTVATTTAYQYSKDASTVTSLAIGLFAEMEVEVNAAGTVQLRLNTEDSGEGYSVAIRATTTTVDVYDYGATATVGSSLGGLSGGDRLVLRLRVAGGKVFAAARVQDSGEFASRKWVTLANGVSLTDTGGTGGAVDYYVRFGHPSTVDAADFHVHRVSVAVVGDLTDGGYAAGFTNPGDLLGRPLSGEPIELDNGLRIRATDGPAAYGETWEIATRYDYAVEHMLSTEHPGRAREWRSSSYATQTIAFQGDYTHQDPSMHGLMLIGLNCPIVRLQYASATTSPTWTTIDTVDLRTSFSFLRYGGSVYANGTDATGPYVERDELAGGLAYFASNKVRRITGNTAGYLGVSGHIPAVLTLDPDDYDGTEATSGTVSILPPDVTVVFTNSQIAAGYRIAFDPAGATPANPQGYVGCKSALFGEVVVFGTKPARTRRMPVAVNVDIAEDTAGHRRARVRGRPRETFDLSWTEGVDTVFTDGATAGDDMVTALINDSRLAAQRETSRVAHALYRAINGGATVIGYLPYIENTDSTPGIGYTLLRARGSRMCRIIGRLEREVLAGDTEVDEVIRFSMQLEEEL